MANNGHKSARKPLKHLKMVKDERFPNMMRIVFDEGGKVPEVVSGMYNSKTDAQNAIDDWTEGRTRDKITPKPPKNDIPQKLAEKKVEKDGEAASTS